MIRKERFLILCAALALIFSASVRPVRAGQSSPSWSAPQLLPTGMSITPTAAAGARFRLLRPGYADHPNFAASDAVTTALSPDGKTLLILTSGYNRVNDEKGKTIATESGDFVFVYDVSRVIPKKLQVLRIGMAFDGLAWNPSGDAFYVSGGAEDCVHIFERSGNQWGESGSPISLGHSAGLGIDEKPLVAGLAVTPSGRTLVAANYENDSISLVDLTARRKVAELDLRPGKSDPTKSGVPGGEYPYWVALSGEDVAYVSSLRDREIDVVALDDSPHVTARIPVHGSPNRILLNRDGSRLYVALDNSDSVAVIDTHSQAVVSRFGVTSPAANFANTSNFRGSNPNSLALSPDERTLYVTDGGTNAVAVVRLDGVKGEVAGLIPTGWYPNSVSVSKSGTRLYVVNGKSVAGPNPQGCRSSTAIKGPAADACRATNQYILQLTRAGFLSFPAPGPQELARLTAIVAENDHFQIASLRQSTIAGDFLHNHIRHVIYIIKENRSYDQVLGDLGRGNGDPKLTLLPEPITPNHHRIARTFVTLDNFYVSGEVSGDGWNWSTAARATDALEKTVPMEYAEHGAAYDYEGTNRNVNPAYPTPAERRVSKPRTPDDPDLLPGPADAFAPDDSDDDGGAGYLWDDAMKAGLSLRNYGFFLDLDPYDKNKDEPAVISLQRNPHAQGQVVAFPTRRELMAVTDPYFRGFDLKFPDYWRVQEWKREFSDYVANKNLPTLELLRLGRDHFGDFADAIDGANTVETEMADNDYAVGLVLESVANSPYRDDTLIFVVEDDAQNGPDHVDAHRTVALVAGPYVRQNVVVSRHYSTVNLLRTMEDILGIAPLGLNDASVEPMSAVFERTLRPWSYQAAVPQVLRTTSLPLPPLAAGTHLSPREAAYAHPRHDAAYWADKTRGMNFSDADQIDTDRFNHILWQGLRGNTPFPETPKGGTGDDHDPN
jgi:YVTN family beta-propeller protein